MELNRKLVFFSIKTRIIEKKEFDKIFEGMLEALLLFYFGPIGRSQ